MFQSNPLFVSVSVARVCHLSGLCVCYPRVGLCSVPHMNKRHCGPLGTSYQTRSRMSESMSQFVMQRYSLAEEGVIHHGGRARTRDDLSLSSHPLLLCHSLTISGSLIFTSSFLTPHISVYSSLPLFISLSIPLLPLV